MKKVDRTKVRDRSTPMVPGAETDTGPAGSGMPPAGGGGGGMQDALAAALAKRKKKIVDSGKFETMWSETHGRVKTNLCQMMRRIRMMMIGEGCSESRFWAV